MTAATFTEYQNNTSQQEGPVQITGPEERGPEMATNTTTPTTRSWQELCPDGRILYYEGDDPEGFRAEIQEEFGFDIAVECDAGPGIRSVKFGEWAVARDGERFMDLRFFCPGEHLDAIDGDEDRWPLGS